MLPPTRRSRSLRAAGGKAIACVANTVEMAQAERLVQAAVDAYGKIDIIVNNAGVTRDKMFHGLDDAQFDFVFDANLKTGFHTTLAAMPYLREVAKKEIAENGKVAYNRKIVFTSSVAALIGNPGQYNYTAAKGCGHRDDQDACSRTRSIRNQRQCGCSRLRRDAPDGREGAEQDLGIPEEMRQMAKMMISLGRLGQPEDIANVTAFLVSSVRTLSPA